MCLLKASSFFESATNSSTKEDTFASSISGFEKDSQSLKLDDKTITRFSFDLARKGTVLQKTLRSDATSPSIRAIQNAPESFKMVFSERILTQGPSSGAHFFNIRSKRVCALLKRLIDCCVCSLVVLMLCLFSLLCR